jgi:hypothetical protein
MARPIDPTSRNQIEQRAKRLRSEESRWTQSLCLGIAMAALKATFGLRDEYDSYVESDGGTSNDVKIYGGIKLDF